MKKREALSLLDLDVRHEMVAINEEQSLRVRGVSSEDVKTLMTRYPMLQGLTVGRGVDRTMLFHLGPEVIAALCAAATGELGNEEAEKRAADLPIELQLDILEAMWRCTFSKGFGPFANRLATAARALFVQDGRVQDTNLQRPSKPSEEPLTPPSGS